MKKTVSFILVLCMLVASMTMLTGCKDDKKDVLTMATNAEFPPYEYYENQEIVGIDAEIAQEIAKKLGMELEIVSIQFGAIVTGVSTGKYDMGMAGMTVTEDRKKSVDFSDTYATGIQVVIVKEDSPITTVDDLFADGATYKAGVQSNTTGDIYASAPVDEDGLGENRVLRYEKGADAVQGLITDKVDCVIIDNEPAKAFVAANEGLKILETEFAVEDYAICFAKDSKIKDKVNDALKELIADGTVQKIIDKYIKAE